VYLSKNQVKVCLLDICYISKVNSAKIQKEIYLIVKAKKTQLKSLY